MDRHIDWFFQWFCPINTIKKEPIILPITGRNLATIEIRNTEQNTSSEVSLKQIEASRHCIHIYIYIHILYIYIYRHTVTYLFQDVTISMSFEKFSPFGSQLQLLHAVNSCAYDAEQLVQSLCYVPIQTRVSCPVALKFQRTIRQKMAEKILL